MAYDSGNRWAVRGAVPQVDIDVGLREYMLRIYNYMASGLALTGIVAYAAAASGFYYQIAGTPLMWVVMLAPLGLVFWLSAGIERMSASTAQLIFWVYAGLMGLSLAGIFLVYTGASIARVFFITDDPARPGAVRLVPDDGADRHHHRLSGQHVHRLECGSIRHLGDRRPHLRRADRLGYAGDQGDVRRVR
jgi:hypothetical protein